MTVHRSITPKQIVQYIQNILNINRLHNHAARLLQLPQHLGQQRIDHFLDLVLLLALLLLLLLVPVVGLLLLAGV